MPASLSFARIMAGAALLLLAALVGATFGANVGAAKEIAPLGYTVIYKNSAEPRIVGSPNATRVSAVPCQVTREQFERSVAGVAASWKFLEGEEAEKFLRVFNSWGNPTDFKADLIAFGFNSSGQIVGVALYLDGCTTNATALKPDQYRMLMEKALGRVVGWRAHVAPGGGTGV